MSGSYSPSTIARLGDIREGVFVETSANISYALWGVGVQAYPFKFYNRIVLHAFFMEVGETTLDGAGCLMLFNYIQDTPSIAVGGLSIVGTTIHGFIRGRRVSLVKDAVGTAAAVTASAGISYHPDNQMILGVKPSAAGVTSVGRLGVLTSIAVLTAGTASFGCLYSALDPGSAVEALL